MKNTLCFFSIVLIAVSAIMFSSCQKDEISFMENNVSTLKGAVKPIDSLQVDVDWLTVALTDEVDNLDGTWTFTVVWTLASEADLEELVKTQGGLTAGVDTVSTENLTSPWKKQPKKNFILWGEEDGLISGSEILYTVVFIKEITALSGEEVELTGDWTSKWKEAEPILLNVDGTLDEDGVPDALDDYWVCIEHQVGYAEPVMWTVP